MTIASNLDVNPGLALVQDPPLSCRPSIPSRTYQISNQSQAQVRRAAVSHAAPLSLQRTLAVLRMTLQYVARDTCTPEMVELSRLVAAALCVERRHSLIWMKSLRLPWVVLVLEVDWASDWEVRY